MPENKLLIKSIEQEINQSNGYISFARFMDMALYTPSLGYYQTAKPKIGERGDFITAPEISPLFGSCIAKQIQEVFCKLTAASASAKHTHTPHKDNITPKNNILEIGAGSGKLACDILLALEEAQALPENYYIYEISNALITLQQTTLQKYCPHLFNKIKWLNSYPDHFMGVIIANEVLDALPFHCFTVKDKHIYERVVTVKNNTHSDSDATFEWELNAYFSKHFKSAVENILNECEEILSQSSHTTYQSEINLQIQPWLTKAAKSLSAGMILLIDYGYGRKEYYHPDRNHGTLMCFFQHQKQDNPFIHIGTQDITAHIDFTAVAQAAMDSELTLAGYTTQSAFLLSCGLLNLAEQNLSKQGQANYHLFQHQQNLKIKKLTLPSQMGEIIKVMALTKNINDPLLGFQFLDRKKDL